MLYRTVVLLAMVGTLAYAGSGGEFKGEYCSGRGDAEYLRLIDRSFGYFHPNPDTPNISMLYYPEWDCLIEGFPTWMAWWIQNSYGPTYCSLPFLREPWLTFLQHSQDMWFDNQGDGRKGGYAQFAELIGPEGCLCDCATPEGAIYRQGDGNWRMHDWGFEFTAAGVVMQAELLLISRDKDAARKYLPNLERACDFIETARDRENNLFLVGPAANLLAPSYGGIRQADGSFGKGYLAGLSITYLAALDRMVELQKLVGDASKASFYDERRRATRGSLSRLVTPEGYFVKSVETDGTKHGVLGQEKYGYFEAVANVDAVAFRVADHAQSRRIYAKIASIPELRPHDFIITNYPSLDDMYDNWESTDHEGLWTYGIWVNGGAWSTVEARAIMAYYRLGEFDDVRRSALHSERLAKDYQMDAPLKDFGAKVWFDDRLTNLCWDALGIPAATARGLFEYVYKADSLTLFPHVPPGIAEYSQKEPVRFGEKRITVSLKNGGPAVKSLKVNGSAWKVDAVDRVVLPFEKLPKNARVEIVTAGGWPSEEIRAVAEANASGEAAVAEEVELPAGLRSPFESLSEVRRKLRAGYERDYADEALRAFQAYRTRASRDASGWYSDLTPDKRAAVMKMYEDAAMNMFKGFDGLMKRYASGTDRERQIAARYTSK